MCNFSLVANNFSRIFDTVLRLEQGCSLGLDVSVSRRSRDLFFKCLGLVSVSRNCGMVLVSVSSRTENQMSRSRLGSRGLKVSFTSEFFWSFFRV